ncbi:MAG: hypothetical protein ACYC8V_14595 [Caulobacteraceae bacterium]
MLAIVVVGILQQYEVLPTLEGSVLGMTTTEATSEFALVNAGLLGGVGGLISTGSLKGGLLGSAEAVTFFEVGNVLEADKLVGAEQTAATIVAHGFVGGLFTVAGGGNFSSGFLAAGVGSLAPAPTPGQKLTFDELTEGTAESAILGGVGSLLGGGKFQNGAITGAFGYLFNEVAHRWASQASAGGALLGGAAVSGACDAATEGVCVLGTPVTLGAGAALGGAIGYATGYGAGSIADDIDALTHGNSANSMQGTELYYIINRTSGAIDKIGVTSYPGERYSQAYLNIENVRYVTQYYFQRRYAAYVAENIELTWYQIQYGQLPRLNQITH